MILNRSVVSHPIGQRPHICRIFFFWSLPLQDISVQFQEEVGRPRPTSWPEANSIIVTISPGLGREGDSYLLTDFL